MKTITSFPRKIVENPDVGIEMQDGCVLSARIWLPEDAEKEPVPAILEHIPYRKRDGTAARDSLTHPYFAGHGYAAIRVDMRGNGDSAGGNLAAAVSHAARGHARAPVGQVLIYPMLGNARGGPSYREHAEAPMLTLRDLDFYAAIRGAGPAGDASLYPLADADFSGLPPTVAFTAECDPLSSDGQIYRDRIIAAGGKAWWYEEPGLVHGYLRARHAVGRARAGFSRIVGAVTALGRGDWPY
jgi:hypothetical protein